MRMLGLPRLFSFLGSGAAALCGALLFLGSARAAAPARSATDSIRAANDRLRELLGQETQAPAQKQRIEGQIMREVRELLDIDFLTQRALVDHWDKMTPKQRSEIQGALRAIVEKNYLSELRGNLDYKMDYADEEAKGADVLVRTVIHAHKNGRPSKLSVDYELKPDGERWRVFDVITEEVSILQNYRAQFNRIIAKEGVDGLIARMKSKVPKGAE